MILGDIGLEEAENILEKTSSKIVQHETVFELLQKKSLKSNYLSTGIPPLDRILSGGLILGTITEVCGPPGIG